MNLQEGNEPERAATRLVNNPGRFLNILAAGAKSALAIIRRVISRQTRDASHKGVTKIVLAIIKRWAASRVLLILVAILVPWYLFRPQGYVLLDMEDALKQNDHQDAIRSLFYNSFTYDDLLRRYHAQLSFQTKLEGPLVPPSLSSDRVHLHQVITDFSYNTCKNGQSEWCISINGKDLVQFLYGLTPWRDYILSIRAFEKTECPKSAARGGAEETCYTVTAMLDPIEPRGRKFNGTVAEIEKDLYVYLYRSFWTKRRQVYPDAEAIDGFLPASEFSRLFRSLELTAKGFEYLTEGDIRCYAKPKDHCVSEAKEAFKEAIASEESYGQHINSHNPSAFLGLGLVELWQAANKVYQQKPALDVESSLDSAIKHLVAVQRDSPFLEAKLKSNGFLNTFKFLWSKLTIKPELINRDSLSAYRCGMYAYRMADYNNAALNLSKVKDKMPHVFDPYVQGYWYDASLYDTGYDTENDIELVEKLLSDLDRLRQQNSNIWAYQAIYGSHVCRLNANTDDAQVDEALDQAQKLAMISAHQRIETNLRRLICLAQRDKALAALKGAAGVAKELDESTLTLDNTERARLRIELGVLYASAGDFAKAADYFLTVAKNGSPFVRNRVLRVPELKAFRDEQNQYNRFLINSEPFQDQSEGNNPCPLAEAVP